MKKRLKAKWLKALRSGEYEQQTPAIAYQDGNKYCCLGVLGKCVMGLPGQQLRNDFNKVGIDDEMIQKLIVMNDKGRTFKQIATYVARYL